MTKKRYMKANGRLVKLMLEKAGQFHRSGHGVWLHGKDLGCGVSFLISCLTCIGSGGFEKLRGCTRICPITHS